MSTQPQTAPARASAERPCPAQLIAAEPRPWRALPWLILAGFLLRAAVALAAENPQHPDEVFQYLEQAHRLVFGYGIVPWEYRFGTRSWIVPGFIAGLLEACRWTGLEQPRAYIPAVKLAFCALSVSLVPSVYSVARALLAERAARSAAIFAALWYELLFFAHKPMPDALSTCAFFAALALALGPASGRRALAVGALAAAAVAVRLQSLPLAALLGLVVLVRWPLRWALAAGAAALAVAAGAGLLDRIAWGGWFASYINNYRFNAVYGVSSIFGRSPPAYYARTLAISSLGLAVPGLLGLLAPSGRTRWPAWPLLLGALLTLGSYTLIAHKEHRFVFAVIPMWLIGLAAALDRAAEELRDLARRQRMRARIQGRLALLGPAAIGWVACVSALGLLGRLPREWSVYAAAPLASQSALVSYRMLADDPELRALLDETGAWWSTGGYYYLHRDVPLYFRAPRDPAPLPEQRAAAYASHVLRPAGGDPLPGFALARSIGSLELWKRTASGADTDVAPGYTRSPAQEGIDDRFSPTVTPRW